jgi:molybdenum cofactor cytidylyltransferase
MHRIGAVVLAAGESARFGEPKQLVRFRGHTLIDGAIAAAQEANCRPIVVVVGSDAAKIVRALGGGDILIEKNARYRDGMGTSIVAGVKRLIEIAPETEAVVLLVCDQPFVTGEVISGLIERWSATHRPIVASGYAETLGVPVLFERSCFDELLQIANDNGAKPVILKNRDRVTTVPFRDGRIDIDTPNDYAKWHEPGP